MKQLLQSVSQGTAFVADVPAPKPRSGEVLVRVSASVISSGTEKSAIDFAGKNLIQKALSRPDLARQVAEKARHEGVLSTWESVRNRLDTDLALGYSSAGTVVAVGHGITDLKPGDWVACAGGGYASHAELVRVPRNLVCRFPSDELGFEQAAFATVASIAMQGFRLAELQVGETAVIMGLGLIGLLAIQIAKAAGCTVIGTDPNPARRHLAEELGCDCTAQNADDLRHLTSINTNSVGADAVIVTAATQSNHPVEVAGEIARQRGHVIVVGAVGLTLPRQPFYDKELIFRISCSYGPGRYDHNYEENGQDYPIGFARWTENRNMQAVLQLMAAGKLKVQPLITHRFSISEAHKGYEIIAGNSNEPFLGIVIKYPNEPNLTRRIDLGQATVCNPASDKVAVGFVGAGNFATGVLLPKMKKVPAVEFVGLCTSNGATAHGVGSRLGFQYCTTDYEEILNDTSLNTVVIATRHTAHAAQISSALQAGKHVFCEKPLCVNEEELIGLVRTYHATQKLVPRMLMVGFNRRFAPLALKLKQFMGTVREPILVNYRINAGFIPPSHWVQDPAQGAGRIIGELCHFVDLCSFLTGSMVASVHASCLPNSGRYVNDNVVATLTYDNGSIATITYVANGDKSLPKERIELFGGGIAAVLDDFRSLTLIRSGRTSVSRSWLRQDKGHSGEWRAFATALQAGGPAPTFESIVNTTLTTFRIETACASGLPQTINTQVFIADALPEADGSQ